MALDGKGMTPTDGARLCGRGVWNAPWSGPNGELVLLAIDSQHRLINGPMVVARGTDHVMVADAMWDLLDACDWQERGVLGDPPSFGALKVPARFSGTDRSHLALVPQEQP